MRGILPLEGPNQLSGYLGILLPSLAARLLSGRAGILSYVALIAGTGAAILTLSRSGIVATAIALAFVIVLAGAAAATQAIQALRTGSLEVAPSSPTLCSAPLIVI